MKFQAVTDVTRHGRCGCVGCIQNREAARKSIFMIITLSIASWVGFASVIYWGTR